MISFEEFERMCVYTKIEEPKRLVNFLTIECKFAGFKEKASISYTDLTNNLSHWYFSPERIKLKAARKLYEEVKEAFKPEEDERKDDDN